MSSNFSKNVTIGQPCDISGIEDHTTIDRAGGIQWPLPQGQKQSFHKNGRLFEDGKFYHPDGRAKFLFDAAETDAGIAQPEVSAAVTDRTRHLPRSGTRKPALVNRLCLRKLYPQRMFVEINPHDAEELGYQEPTKPSSSPRSATGSKRKAVLTHAVRPGQVFIPMHYEAANRLTLGTFDPHSHQPAYKGCAVRVVKDDQ